MMTSPGRVECLNRRRERRNQVDGIATVKVLAAAHPGLEGQIYVADLFDVSASGLRLACSELLDGCVLLLNIELSGASDLVPVQGEVLWASMEVDGSTQMGVEFKDNDPAVIVKWHSVLENANR